MRRTLFILSAVVASACSSSDGSDTATDYTSFFAGVWRGTLTATDSTGESLGSVDIEVNIEATSRNYLKIENGCFNYNSGPTVFATSATAFSSVGPYTCNGDATANCNAVVVTWNSVYGGLSGSTLQFTGSLTGSQCGATADETWEFINGTRVPI